MSKYSWAVELHPDDKSAHVDLKIYNKKGQLEGELCMEFSYTSKDGIILEKTNV